MFIKCLEKHLAKGKCFKHFSHYPPIIIISIPRISIPRINLCPKGFTIASTAPVLVAERKEQLHLNLESVNSKELESPVQTRWPGSTQPATVSSGLSHLLTGELAFLSHLKGKKKHSKINYPPVKEVKIIPVFHSYLTHLSKSI